jgi:ribonuclease D
MCYEDIMGSSFNTKHSSISLNDLLKEYLNFNHSMKNELHNDMKNDPYFWKKRPITEKMLDYTADDVLYLDKIYSIIKTNCEKGNYKNLTFDRIQYECKKYLEYCKINLGVKNFNKISIEKDKIVEGLLK